MTATIIPFPDALKQEVEFWLDFIHWWEHKHGRQAEGRILDALADADRRYRDKLAEREE